MGLVGPGFASDLFAAEFVLGLSGAEEIGRQFGAAHVVEDLFALLQSLAAVDVLGAESAVEAHVAVVLEDGVVAGLGDSGSLRGIGELAAVGAEVRANGESAPLFHLIITQLLAARLDCEIGLALGDDFFRRIGVLDDEVASIARHRHGLQFTLRAAADFDHLVGSDEMILHPLPTVEKGGAGLLDDRLNMAVVHIVEHAGKVSAGSELVVRRIGPANGFERGDCLAHVKGEL